MDEGKTKKLTHGRWRGLALAIVLAGFAACFSGCQAIGFYRQAISGQYEILAHQKPIAQLIADTNTLPKLRSQLEKILRIREFAAKELKLPADEAYFKYVDLHRHFVVWNVNVAPVLSTDPKTWWFPIVGEASYRGYFSKAGAEHYAERWKKKGYDVYVDGVDAYSTLGWFRDPLLSTFIYLPEADLAELIFHELAHRKLFVNGDTDFNEAFATEVASEGIRRWFAASAQTNAYEAHRQRTTYERQFVQIVLDARGELDKVYDDFHLTEAQKLISKAEVIANLRARYAAVKKTWNGESGYDEWFAKPINNAKINTVSAYYEFAPAFRALLKSNDNDMNGFFAAVGALKKLPLEKRHDALRALVAPKN